MNDMADRIVAANPELGPVKRKRDNLFMEYDFLAGVSAGYNPNDISHYLTTITNVRLDPAPDAQMAQFRQMTGMRDRLGTIGEVLKQRNGSYIDLASGAHFSPATLDVIDEQARTKRILPETNPAPQAQGPK